MSAMAAARAELIAPRELILNVATHLFGVKGYAGTSMRDIAHEVGVLPGSLYAHIDSKETLLAEIVGEGIESFIGIVQPIVGSAVAADAKLRAAIIAHVGVVAQGVERAQVVFHQWRFLQGARLDEAIAKRALYADAFAAILREGVATGMLRRDLDVAIAVRTVLGALNWTPEWYRADGSLSAADVGEVMATNLIPGLLALRS